MVGRLLGLGVALGLLTAPGMTSAQTAASVKFSRVVDLTLPIESNMAGIPGLKIYAENPSNVGVIAAMTDAQKEQLRAEGKSMEEVAESRNAEGFHPPKRVGRFTGGMVAGFLARQYAKAGQAYGQRLAGALRKGEWLLGDLARHLGMPAATLHHWRKLGWVRARKLPVAGGLWAIRASGPERRRLARLRRYQQAKPNQKIPDELTTPQAGKKK